jgi:aspartate ammonia-lyase
VSDHKNDYRIERDILGEKEIPNSAYWGIHTARALDNFPYYYSIPSSLKRAFFAVKWACAQANYDLGFLEPSLGPAIIKACEEGHDGKWDDSIVIPFFQGGAGTSLNMNVNEVITNRALEISGYEKGRYDIIHPLDHVNRSQSTNDTFPTALKMSLIRMLEVLKKEVVLLINELRKKEKEFSSILKIGRTELQDAVPITLGMEFSAWAEAISRDRQRLEKTQERLREINLGGTAVGTGLNAHPDFSMKAIGFLNQISKLSLIKANNMFENTQNCDVFANASGALKILAINLRKIANDLRLLAMGPRAGIGEIILPPLQQGSSIMPGKINPVMCEYLEGIAIDVIGKDASIAFSCSSGLLELNHLLPFIGANLSSMIIELTDATRKFQEKYVRHLEAHADRCQELLEKSYAYATAIVPYLGYDITSQLVLESLDRNLTLREIIIEKKLFTNHELNKILDPLKLTRPGIPGHFIVKEEND